jgi:competence protein ComEC
VAFGCLVLYASLPQEAAAPSNVAVTFLDVGQGDAAVIRLPSGQVWLVDGGGLPFALGRNAQERRYRSESPARLSVLPYLQQRSVRQIDLAIISHPHPDHYVGLMAVSRRLVIREVWTTVAPNANGGEFARWLALLQATGTRIRRPRLGEARRDADAALHVLWPQLPPEALAQADPVLSVNDNSIVVRLDVRGRRILFAGDLEAEGEELVAELDIAADVMKVAHHGSKTSSTAHFRSATAPSLAVISCGVANRFDFPSPEVEGRWRERARILRTDQVGTIELEIDASGRIFVETAVSMQGP